MEGGVMSLEVLMTSKYNPMGEEQVLGLDLIAVRDDDGLTRPLQGTPEAMIHHI